MEKRPSILLGVLEACSQLFWFFFECAGLALLLLLLLRCYSSPAAAAAASFSRSYILRLRLMIFPQPRKRKLACVWRCQDGCQPFARLSNNHVVNRYRAHRNSEKGALPLTRVEFITFVLVPSMLCVCVCMRRVLPSFSLFWMGVGFFSFFNYGRSNIGSCVEPVEVRAEGWR